MIDTKYIAIADDHTLFRKGLMSLINLFPGYKVLFDASDGKEFIELLKEKSLPDIALLDIVMPKMDGYATSKCLKINYPQIKVLALSTMDSDAAIIKMIRNGAKGYVLKDADPEELRQAFKEVLSSGYFYNDAITRKVMRSINDLDNLKADVFSFSSFNEREEQFVKLCCSEKTYKEIADEMFVSERTVDNYRESVFKKINVSSRVGIVMYAIKNGMVKL
jgi:DNA-binding NarL/FixJ family response regulator